MSSRALRRAQKELDEKRQLEQLKLEEEAETDVSDDSRGESVSRAKPSFSAFALLDQDDENDGEEDHEDTAPQPDRGDNSATPDSSSRAQPSKSSKRKKKKSKKKVDSQETSIKQHPRDDTQHLDEIDTILRQLSQEVVDKSRGQEDATANQQDEETLKLLSVDTQHLHATNEMRRLFGRAAMEEDHADQDRARTRGRGQRQAGIGAAVVGRRGGGGKLASIALRRNPFIQGKEDWPQASSGGLGMEVIEKQASGITTYTYVHSRVYQDVQRQFQQCVEMGDPQQMVNHLAYNPYHISTLLQVSEIAKNMERDHATAGDLLERALFALGRSVHSTFGKALAQGKARLDFRRSENREFWLASWRYIENLSMRATWRTVFEWAKMLLSLDPDRDPYCIRLVLDQYALRARQPNELKLFYEKLLQPQLGERLPPHLAFSYSLALVQGGEAQKGRQQLQRAIERAPWIANRMCQELNLEPIPPAIWGKQAPTELDNLYSELYAQRGKDVWNSPEATSLLMSVAHTVDKNATAAASSSPGEVTIDMARHVVLSDKRELLALIPRHFTTRLTSSSDPLPPDDAITAYSTEPSQRHGRLDVGIPDDMAVQIQRLAADIESLGVDGLLAEGDETDGEGAPPPPDVRNAEGDVADRRSRLQRLTAEINSFMQTGGSGAALLELLRAYNREALPDARESDDENEMTNDNRARVEDAEDEG